MTKLAKEIGDSLDSHVLKVLKEAVQAHRTSQERPAHEDAPEIDGVIPNVRSASSVLCSFTPEKLFQRCSGDAAQLENADEVGAPSLRGSVHFGRMINADEVYAAFQAFGLIQEEHRRGAAVALCVNQHCGALNRLLQWGECSRSTRSAGSFGGGKTPSRIPGVDRQHAS